MDPRYFGSNLLTFNDNHTDRRRSSARAAEDAYYERHAPAERRIPRIVSILAVASFGFLIIGTAWADPARAGTTCR
jgi:hypothetical protein